LPIIFDLPGRAVAIKFAIDTNSVNCTAYGLNRQVSEVTLDGNFLPQTPIDGHAHMPTVGCMNPVANADLCIW